jgi:excisionase family DNA binding protein
MTSPPRAPTGSGARFLSVAEAARIFNISEVTLYREIRGGRFPAVKIRGRYVVPARAVAAMEDAAVDSGALVDAADWAAQVSAVHAGHDDYQPVSPSPALGTRTVLTPKQRLAAALVGRADVTA